MYEESRQLSVILKGSLGVVTSRDRTKGASTLLSLLSVLKTTFGSYPKKKYLEIWKKDSIFYSLVCFLSK